MTNRSIEFVKAYAKEQNKKYKNILLKLLSFNNI